MVAFLEMTCEFFFLVLQIYIDICCYIQGEIMGFPVTLIPNINGSGLIVHENVLLHLKL